MRDQSMNETRDPIISQLFANEERALPEMDFLKQLLARLEREQRKRRIYMTISAIFVIGLGAIIAPWATERLSIFIELGDQGMNALGAALQSPISWLVVVALLISFAPLAIVWRVWRIFY